MTRLALRIAAAALALAAAAPAPAALADTTLTTCDPGEFAAATAAGGTVTFAVNCPNLLVASTTNVPAHKTLTIDGDGHAVTR